MKKLIMSALLLASAPSFADFELIQLLNFKGSYESPEGTATAEKFIVPDFNSKKLKQSLVNIKLSQQDNGYLLSYADKEFLFENPPEFLKDVDKVNWNSIDLLSKQKRFSLNVSQLSTQGTDGKASFSKLKLECIENDPSITSFGLKLLDSCSTKATASFSKIVINKTLRPIHLLEALKSSMLKLTTNKSNTSLNNRMEFSNFSFSSNNNNFSLKITAKTSMKAKVKMSGHMSFDKTKNVFKIKINKAKSGFISVKKMIFKELKKQQSENFRVSKPYIYIHLQDKEK